MFERDSAPGATTSDLPMPERAGAVEAPAPPEAPVGGARHGRIVRGWFLRCVAVVAEVTVAFLIRELIAHRHPDFAPFITFYPAVLLASLLDGVWAGMAVTVLATAMSEIWIFAPIGRVTIADPFDVVSLAMFFIFGISLSMVVELYHRNREKLANLLVQEAVSSERRKGEADRKLTESVQAERQRLLDVMEALPAMVSLRRSDHRISFANRRF